MKIFGKFPEIYGKFPHMLYAALLKNVIIFLYKINASDCHVGDLLAAMVVTRRREKVSELTEVLFIIIIKLQAKMTEKWTGNMLKIVML